MIQEVPQKQPLRLLNQIPDYIQNNASLNLAIEQLPSHYNFEIHKSIHRICEMQQKLNKKEIVISLQFPEGLMIYACLISDILVAFTGCETIITGDVTYGACCIDDLTAYKLGSDFIIHYGHSCLIPINETLVKTLYVFVEINIDIEHIYETFIANFTDKSVTYYLMATIQFNNYIHMLKDRLLKIDYKIQIPQEKPRSQGEVLGCTSPKLAVQEKNVVLFICDGRFHMESAMIQNPQFIFYQYDPYTYKLTSEQYDHVKMMEIRHRTLKSCQMKSVCIILGTLGRQGSNHILNRIEQLLDSKQIKCIISYQIDFTLLVSEINFQQLELIQSVDVFIQIACPRISIDWGVNFNKPLITPYEIYVVLGEVQWKDIYPMDYYSNSGGPWTNNYHKQKVKLDYE